MLIFIIMNLHYRFARYGIEKEYMNVINLLVLQHGTLEIIGEKTDYLSPLDQTNRKVSPSVQINKNVLFRMVTV